MKVREAAKIFERIGVEGYNRPKRTPNHPTKSHVVVAKEGDKVKTIRFGQQGVSGSPAKKGESEADKARRKSFKARHAKNIAKGKMSAAYWSDKIKWTIMAVMLNGAIMTAYVANTGFSGIYL
jgi:hypothetical protein